MRILIIEDEIIIARFIEQQLIANFSCTTAIALNQKEVLDTMPVLLPQLIVCDINLKEEMDGMQIIETLRGQFVFEVIFITSYQSKGIIESALRYQPLNYLIKPVDEAAIYAAFRLAWPLLEANSKLGTVITDTTKHPLFSSTEQSILRLILQSKTSKEIASLLFLSPYTIKNHRHSICRKLALKDGNNALLKWAMQNKELLEENGLSDD